jgi:FkbM family methyltransferase
MSAPASLVRRALGRAFWLELIDEAGRMVDVLSIVPGAVNRVRLIDAWVRLTLKLRLGIWPDLTFRVTWRGPGGEVSAVVGDVSELRVIREMFVLEEYKLPDDFRPSTIVDLGSNVGISVLYFKARYPDARVIAVEAHPEAFARLARNTEHLEGVDLVQAAVADREGTLPMYVGGESWAATVNPGGGRDNVVEVPATTLDRVIGEHGLDSIDLLKMDIEGSEIAVLRSAEAPRQARMMVFEFHQEHSDESLWDLLRQLPEFRLVRCVGDSAVHPLVTLAREQAA